MLLRLHDHLRSTVGAAGRYGLVHASADFLDDVLAGKLGQPEASGDNQNALVHVGTAFAGHHHGPGHLLGIAEGNVVGHDLHQSLGLAELGLTISIRIGHADANRGGKIRSGINLVDDRTRDNDELAFFGAFLNRAVNNLDGIPVAYLEPTLLNVFRGDVVESFLREDLSDSRSAPEPAHVDNTVKVQVGKFCNPKL